MSIFIIPESIKNLQSNTFYQVNRQRFVIIYNATEPEPGSAPREQDGLGAADPEPKGPSP